MLDRLRTRLARAIAPDTGRRSYDAASGARRAGSLGTFNAHRAESVAAPRIRSRARYLAANSPLVAGALGNLTAHTIGSGSRPLPDAPDGARRALADAWRAWTAACDVDGEADFATIEADAFRAMATDGEALLELIPDPDGLRLRALPSDLIDSTKTANLAGGREIISGIEYDANGRIAAYWLFPRPAGLLEGYQPSRRVEASRIVRLYRPEAPGAVRGISWLSPVVIAASELDGLLDALVMGARIAASHAGFVTSPDAEANSDDPLSLDDALLPGRMTRLPIGYDVKFSNPQQITSAGELLRFGVRQIASGLGVPAHMVDGDVTQANYSSLRAATVSFRARVNQNRATILQPRFLNRVWRAWLGIEVLTGRQPEFVATDWIGPAIEGIDPAKDATAVKTRLETGLTSRRAEILATGRDPDKVNAERAAEGIESNGANLA